jgi:diguanylate cyclase (GGDEF)-like protein/PAS domain S-box-containing protein
VAQHDDKADEPARTPRDTMRAEPLPPGASISGTPPPVTIAGSPPESARRSRPTLPSVVEEDEEPEDTLTHALKPLRDAEQGRLSRPPDTTRNTLSPPTLPAADVVSITVEPLPDLRLPRADPGERPVGLEACLSHVGVAVIETDGAGTVLALNAAAERLTGWPAVEAAGMPLDDIFSLRITDGDGPEAALAAALGAAPPEHTAILERRDGRVIPIRHVVGVASGHVDDLAATLPGGSGKLVVFRDVSGEQLLALQLARQARYDALTGLLNRQGIVERIDRALESSRHTGARHVLCYLDLDRFRLVNATCGHDAGEDLLQWVATRIHELLGPTDAAGRIGGDEFAILLDEQDEREGERVARDLQKRLLEFRFGFEDKTFTVGASFGVVPFGAEMRRATEVLGAADHACRLAKDAGRGRIQIYREDDDQMAEKRRSVAWVAGLQKNLEEGRLRLFAQSINPLAIETPVGAHFEILVRRVTEDGRFISPVGIIQAAENSGMMDAIDRFVVKTAFRTIGALPQKAMRRLDTCAINLSGISLLREGLLDFIVQEMNRSNVPPSKICFEITETAALANLGEVLWLMQELGAMGCRFAIDDFGSGQASYGYLENLPVDYVKIDGVFVRDLPDNALHRAIVESVHRIGCTLGIKTVAEAVETQAIADVLRGIGVHYAQGWLYAKPEPLGDICARLDT